MRTPAGHMRQRASVQEMRSNIGVRRHRVNVKRITLIIVVAAIIIVGLMLWSYAHAEVTLDEATAQDLLTNGTFQQGVSIGGVDVSGLSMQDAQVAISPVINRMLNSGKIEFTVYGEDTRYEYSLEDMGVSIDPTPVLRDAMLYGREGTRWDVDHEDPEPKDFQLQKTFNIGQVATNINAAASRDEWGEDAVNANYKVEKSKDEDDLTTSARLVSTEPQDGYSIDKDAVISTIENQIMTEQYQAFEAPMSVIQSTGVDTHGGEMSLMGSKTTDFSQSKSDRKYNIWKMASILNGACVMPGDTFSVNDLAGDRTAETGWKEADGIENGQYTPQYGGGICQVSTTLYNVCLAAELNIVNRVPHTIAAKYVPKGLDATISTGGPDYKFSNPYDTPIYVIIKCDGHDGLVTAEIWGYDDRDYKVRVYSEEDVAEREDLPKPQYQRNNELSNGAIERVRSGQQKEVWNVYKDRISKDTDEVVEDKIFVTKSTYNAISPLYDVGPGRDLPADGTPIDSVTGNVTAKDDGIQATPEPTKPTSDSQETSKPSYTDEPQYSDSRPEPTSKPQPTDPPQEPSSDPTQEPDPPQTDEPDPPSQEPQEPDSSGDSDPVSDGGEARMDGGQSGEEYAG